MSNTPAKKKRRPALLGLRRKLYDARECIRHLVGHGCYMNRMYFVVEEKELIYVANSKAASSSIKASMLSLPEQENYHAIHGLALKSGKMLNNIAREDFPGFYRFSFVRNPMERLVSCYKNKYHTDKELQGWDGRANKDLYFENYLMGYLAKDRGFAQFARRVCRIPDCLSDRHFVSQFYMLHQKGRCICDFVGRFEDLPDAFEPIRERFKIDPLPRYNTTKKGNWMDSYDLETAQRIYKRYERDIREYGYIDEYQRLLDHIRSRESDAQ